MVSLGHKQHELFEDNSNDDKTEDIVSPFPEIETEEDNPAILLFGHRYLKDQTELEYLIEMILLFVSEKEVRDSKGVGNFRVDSFEKADRWKGFPDLEQLRKWPEGEPLRYFPSMRFMLKLFAFLGASGVEGRHKSHLQKHADLVANLKNQVNAKPSMSKDEVLELLEQVLVGFIGVSGTRTWCAQSFLPVSPRLIAGETIWKKTSGNREPNLSWEQVYKKGFFTFGNHRFLARGGELLYLQLCNLFRKIDSEDVAEFERKVDYPNTAKTLCDRLETNLKKFLTQPPAPVLDRIGKWIESNEGETAVRIQREEAGATCGWCPEESWPEAYLFAVEMGNICEAMLDPMERIEMLKLCCVFQVLRSLCAQAGRHWPSNPKVRGEDAVQPYTWILTDPDLKEPALKAAGRQNLIRVKAMIHGALRTFDPQTNRNGQDTYKNADEQGQELFVKLGKKIGLIVPYNGPGARLVLQDNLLRYLVLALVPPGKRMRLNIFLKTLYRHYGAAISGDLLNDAVAWTYPEQQVEAPSEQRRWLEEKLLATGFLIPLSDAVSLIHNPFSKEEA